MGVIIGALQNVTKYAVKIIIIIINFSVGTRPEIWGGGVKPDLKLWRRGELITPT